MEMKKVIVKANIEIMVEVPVTVGLEDAEKIALFNVEPLISSINSDLNEMLNDIEIYDCEVISTEELD